MAENLNEPIQNGEPVPQTNPPLSLFNTPRPDIKSGHPPASPSSSVDKPSGGSQVGKRGEKKIYLCEADLKEGELRGVKTENQWLVLACYQGKTYALDAACAHSGYPLFKGTLNAEGVLTCPLHYMQFDCRTGKVVTSPPMCQDQPTFQIEIEDGKIYWIKKA